MTGKDEGYNFRAINTAFDTMLKEENRSPYEAGFLTMIYAAWLVEDQMGRATRIQLIDNVREELDKAKNGELELPVLNDADRQGLLVKAAALSAGDHEMDYRQTIVPMLQHLTTDLKAAGVPDVEVPPVMADYLGMIALALAQEAGLEAIIGRLEGMVEDYRNRRPPFDERR
jgi:hypothetical protein